MANCVVAPRNVSVASSTLSVEARGLVLVMGDSFVQWPWCEDRGGGFPGCRMVNGRGIVVAMLGGVDRDGCLSGAGSRVGCPVRVGISRKRIAVVSGLRANVMSTIGN